MKTRIQKWGNSLALHIPKAFAVEIGFERNSLVEMTLQEGKLVIAPMDKTKFTLKQLLSQVTEENKHSEVDTGTRVGGEMW